MKEHYSKRLKRERDELESKYRTAVIALKQIALSETLNPKHTADATLRVLGLMPLCVDALVPPDRIFLIPDSEVWKYGLTNKVDDYI